MRTAEPKNQHVFFAWTKISRRSEELAQRFNAEYKRYDRKDNSKATLAFSLLTNAIKTFCWIVVNRPKVIFTFNAHPYITLIAKIATWVTCKGKVIPDLHTAAYTDHYYGIKKIIAQWIWKKCPIVIIHNQESKEFLAKKQPNLAEKLFVLEDAIPDFTEYPKQQPGSSPVGVLVSRFANDEPIEAFLQAASRIKECTFYVTGNFKKAKFDLTPYMAEHIKFPGFVSDNDYQRMLGNADFIAVLTTREMTLLSGGYEALALEKPLILSKTKTLMDYYGDSALYAENKAESIESSIRRILENLALYQEKVDVHKKIKVKDFNTKASTLLDILKTL